jgi:hypothetical protein
LRDFVGSSPLYGIKTGLNEAFILDASTRDKLIAADPRCVELLQPILRGQDINRWCSDWAGLYLVFLETSTDRDWPWSNMTGDASESCFRESYPSIYQHFLPVREKLIDREDQGRFWWELRPCSYYNEFTRPKIVYTDIAWSAEFCLDSTGAFVNNTAYMIASGDPWIAACLNSPTGWWYAWRGAQHGKDEALRYFTSYIEHFPIAPLPNNDRAAVDDCVGILRETGNLRHEHRRLLRDWLRVTWDISKPTAGLLDPFALSADDFAMALRAALPRKQRALSAAAIATIRAEHTATVAPIAARLAEATRHEITLSALVNRAYGLTQTEEALLWETAPPRMNRPGISGGSNSEVDWSHDEQDNEQI